MSLGQHVTIELFGQPYTFKAESEETNTKTVADYLVKEVKRIEEQHGGRQPKMSRLNMMILAAMNIANENIELKEKHSVLINEVSIRSMKLVQRLDTCFPSD